MRKILLFTLVMFSLFVRGQGTITFSGTPYANIDPTVNVGAISVTFNDVDFSNAQNGPYGSGVYFDDSYGNYIYPSSNCLVLTNSRPFVLNSFDYYSISTGNIIVYGYRNGSQTSMRTVNSNGGGASSCSNLGLGIVDKVVFYDSNNITGYNNFSISLPPLTLSESTDNSAIISSNNGVLCDATLTRTLTANQWNTFCVPFNINSGVITSIFGSGTVVNKLTGSNFAGSKVTMTFSAEANGITAGVPYLIKPDNTVVNPSFTSVTVSSNNTPAATTYVSFTGITSPFTLTNGNKNQLFLTSDGTKLLYPSSGAQMKGMRGYFTLTGAAANANTAKSFSLSFDDGNTTAINTLVDDTSKSGSDATYSITGQRVNATYQGIVIKNGKKYINK
jgi:hypothetical protein